MLIKKISIKKKVSIAYFIFLVVLYLSIILSSCIDSNPMKLFRLLPSQETGINFLNKVENLKEFNILKYRNFYNGGGVGVGDINNDGLADLYFTANMGPNKLYLNKGNFKFEDITQSAGVAGTKAWATGVVFVDINADGLLDIYVCNAGNQKGDEPKNELFINNGDLTFTEKAEHYKLADTGFTTHAAFFDYDKDGDLDVYLLNNSFIPVTSLRYSNKRELRAQDWQVNPRLKGGGDKLLRNEGAYFVDVSEKAGIYGSLIGFGLGVTVGDINQDNWPDLYISNDFYERDYLYINNQNGTFTESSQKWAAHTSIASMGADMADINNDGLNDIFVTDMLPAEDERIKATFTFEGYDLYRFKVAKGFSHQYTQNTLQLNTGLERFSEIAHFSGVSKTDWSWAALLFDMDNDGYKDIFVSNGILNDLTDQDFVDYFANEAIQQMAIQGKKKEVHEIIAKMPSTPIQNQAFINNKDLSFSNKTAILGFNKTSFSNGSAYADLDNDGDLDLVVNNINQKAFVYRNQAETLHPNNGFIRVKLIGNSPNIFAVGATVELFAGSEIIKQECIPSRGFQSSVDYILNFGIGTKKIDRIKITWPSGRVTESDTFNTNELLTFSEKDANKRSSKTSPQRKPLLKIVNQTVFQHQENHYVDFNFEGLIKEMLSKEGPAIAKADLNQDGLDDLFIGAASGSSAQLYFQHKNGSFVKQNSAIFKKDKEAEDTAAHFFDADQDGDLDLIVGSGGNEALKRKHLKTRLYINSGKGSFNTKPILIPSHSHNTAVIKAYDFDQDGDEDLFIGSRSVPGIYGINPKHSLLENQGDFVFKDVTLQKAYLLKEIGMITDSTWADINADGLKDLIIVGDWMAPTILINTGKSFKKWDVNLDPLKGWWNSVLASDINQDGLIDLVLGNEGLNIPYKASLNNPIKMYINDFDNNGTIEQIMTQHFEGKDKPIALKKELSMQIPALKKENITYAQYKHKSIDELFSKATLNTALIKSVTSSKSILLIQESIGNFKPKELPPQVQFSPVNAIQTADLNQDSIPDLILGGNNFNYKPQFGRQDASLGTVLLGTPSGEFKWLSAMQSGLYIENVVQDILLLNTTKQNPYLFFGVNNNASQLYRF